MDTEAVPALAAAGALGVLLGRVFGGRRQEEQENGRGAARPVADAAATAGRLMGIAAGAAIKAGGVAVQTVGAAVTATGNITHAAGERVESAVRPGGPSDPVEAPALTTTDDDEGGATAAGA
ncbi:MAG: hypothetical protein M3396_00580 [Actinomycetota bacterium]|nr:hypothetical protein [Actinomycetota bacterium]MDQ3574591.1 hypothetical protein [Actinomycetota bacterium]